MTLKQCILPKFWRNPARAKSQQQRPVLVKGYKCKEGGEPRMESTQPTTMYWQYAREMSHIWIAADKARCAVVPCRVTRQWHTKTAVLPELLRKLQILEGCTRRTRTWTEASKRVLANKYKHASTASKSRQGKTCQKVQAPNCWKTRGVPFSDFLLFVLCGHDFLLNDKLGWQAIKVIEVKLTSQNLQVMIWCTMMHKSALVG